jgi:hypothetical protein
LEIFYQGNFFLKTNQQFYQKQLSQTAANLTGHTYSAAHEVAPAIPVIRK